MVEDTDTITILKEISQRITDLTKQVQLIREMPSVPLELRRLAAQDGAQYIFSNFPNVSVFNFRHETLRYAVNRASRDGLFLEFGVNQGQTITMSAKLRPDIHFWGFDSFEGLPEDWSGTALLKGNFDLKGEPPNVPENVTLVKGWFEESIPKWKSNNNNVISYCHIDSDLYSSAATIFKELECRFKPGTILLFDEYFGYADWRNGEHKAFCEMIERTGFCWSAKAVSHQALVVELGERL